MKYWIITILILLSCRTKAQVIDTLLSMHLLEKEILFFSSQSDSDKFHVLIDKANLQSSVGEYRKALRELERAEKYSSIEKNKLTLKYNKMLNYFLSDQFIQCASITLPVKNIVQINKKKEYFSMRLFSLNETEQWDKCKEELLSFCSECDSNRIGKITSLPITYNYISPEQCKKLSSFIPGLGMVKTGKLFKGVTSFILQSGFAVFAGYSFYSGYYVAGAVSGVFPLLKFHKGGRRLSAILAEEHNEKEKENLKRKYYEEIKKVIDSH